MSLIDGLNKDFESRVRLGIMSILMVNEWVEFGEIKSLLNLTDGNLASHSKALESKEYIRIKKEFIGKKPRTSYQATKLGKKQFQMHINALANLIK